MQIKGGKASREGVICGGGGRPSNTKISNKTKWVQKNFECTIIAKEHSGNIHLSRFKEPNLVMGGSSLGYESTKNLKCKSL